METSTSGPASPLGGKRQLLELPPTALETIFQQFSIHDLASLFLVSRGFRDLAAARLYRDFVHIFNDDEFRGGTAPVDKLSSMLETFATSDYNYARNLRKIELDTAYAADAGERACREFSYEYSCGKLMNSLLLATLKRTHALDSFIWNIRVELSTAVYRALHQMPALQHVHIRLQAGPSLHSVLALTASVSNPITLPPPPGQVALPPPPHPGPPPPHTHSHGPGAFATYPQNAPSRLSRRIPATKPSTQPLTFSGFRGLKSLAILDMDNLEYIPELAACIRSSSRSLKRLKLSFSDNLALKARKKVSQDSDSDETAPEDDDFENETLPPPPPPGMLPNPTTFGPASGNTEGDVRSERIAQEKALARIFGLESETPEGKELERATEDALLQAQKDVKLELGNSRQKADSSFVEFMRTILDSLGKKPTKEIDQAIATLDQLTSKYQSQGKRRAKVHSGPSMTSKKKQAKSKAPPYYIDGPGSEESEEDGTPSPSVNPATFIPSSAMSGDPLANFDFDSFLNTGEDSGGFSFSVPGPENENSVDLGTSHIVPPKSKKLSKKVYATNFLAKSSGGAIVKGKENKKPISLTSGSSSADDEEELEPDAAGDANGGSQIGMDTVATNKPEDGKMEDEFSDDVDLEHPDDDGDDGEDQVFTDEPTSLAHQEPASKVAEAAQEPQVNGTTKQTADVPPSSVSSKGKEAVRDTPTASRCHTRMTTEEAIQEYVRLNHGIPIEELSIYLIPVKPSVLCRAIDVCALKKITLLNVGPQRSFWAMLSKLHRTNPLQLQSIYTDNVTPSFLVFLNGLTHLEDLFLLERNSRTKVEPFAPRTTVVIEEMRKQVLMKHMKTLKTLMIRNDENNDWNLNRETVKLISKEGKNLREIAVAMNAIHFHMLMQSISGLRSLHALQVIYSSIADSCHSVLRELRSCIVDNISHCPNVPVQWVALSHTINGSLSTFLMRLVRTPLPFPGEDSDSDLWEADKIQVLEGLKLREAKEVKIWDKEGWATRL